MKKYFTLLIVSILLTSCKLTKDRISYQDKNYYTGSIFIDYANDSIYFVEFNRNGSIRHNLALPFSQVIITKKK